ncbi:MAG: NAD-dependent epimerase/dehydratase family protein [Anaerolineae bacterium]|nr:NAD-dependent epimerase/dehydratase family protein [Anaerolineae bacterium]
MRYLITGGAGFLGTALANRLAGAGHEVHVLDDLSAGDPSRLRDEVLFTRGDVRDVPKLWSLLQDTDCVYHLAAKVSVPASNLYPRDYNDVNVGGTVCLLEAVRDVGVPKVVLASSGAVYGEQTQMPISEAAVPNPGSPYAVSKLAAEYYCRTVGRLAGFETVVLRIFNTYGPGQPLPASHAPVIPLFLRRAINGGSIVIFGDGNQTRDFVYIDDVTDALVAAGERPGLAGQVINVGSGRECSIRQLVALVEDASGRRTSPIHNPSQEGGVSHSVADISLASQLLGYTPKVSLEDGLRRMLSEDDRFRNRA